MFLKKRGQRNKSWRTNKKLNMEIQSKVKRSELFNEILSIVKKIKIASSEGDAYDHPSISFEVEQLFESKIDEVFNDIHVFYEWAKQKCSTDGRGNWQLITGGVIYNYSTKELYKDWKNNRLP